MPATPHEDFARLIAPHLDALYRAAYRLTAHRFDAQDLVQDVCVRAYAALDALKSIEQPKPWLLKIQYRAFVDGVRHRASSPLRSTDQDLGATTPSIEPGPDDFAEADLAERRILAALAQLDKEQRALLALHIEGYSLAEIRAITDLSTDVLKARLYRARVRLGRLLDAKRSSPALAMES